MNHEISWPQIVHLSQEHIAIATPAIVATLVVSVPLAWLATRHRVVGYVLLQGASLLFAIPALPLLAVIPVAVGLSPTSPLVLMMLLTLYGIAVMSRQVAAAFEALPDDVIRAADAMGYSTAKRFIFVDIPLAWPSITSALRLVSASTLSMTVGALVGIPGLGLFITRGYEHHDIPQIILGMVSIAVLAVLFDGVIVLLSRILGPRGIVQ